jgi:exosortase/archaeosortase family protein
MKFYKHIFSTNSPYIFFIKFLLLFTILYSFFPFYWGITGPGGSIYSSILAEHFNFIKGFATFLTKAAKLLLNISGYDTNQRQYNALRIGYSRGIVVNPSCLGWGVMSFWVAFVYANTGSWQHKAKWILTGVCSIIFLNIFRIALIALANHLNWGVITHLDHHQTFNVASYGCVFILMYWYITVQKKYERIIIGPLEGNDKFSTI